MHNVFAFIVLIIASPAGTTGTPNLAELTAKSNRMSVEDSRMPWAIAWKLGNQCFLRKAHGNPSKRHIIWLKPHKQLKCTHQNCILILVKNPSQTHHRLVLQYGCRGQPVCRKEDCSLFDIGLVYATIGRFSPAEKLCYIQNVWKPDLLFLFPPTSESDGKHRRFRYEWLVRFPWLSNDLKLFGHPTCHSSALSR